MEGTHTVNDPRRMPTARTAGRGTPWVVRLASPWPRDRSVFAPPARHAASAAVHPRALALHAAHTRRGGTCDPSAVAHASRAARGDRTERARLVLGGVSNRRHGSTPASKPSRSCRTLPMPAPGLVHRASPTVRCPSRPSAHGPCRRRVPGRPADRARGEQERRQGLTLHEQAHRGSVTARDIPPPVQGEEQAARAEAIVAARRSRQTPLITGASAARVRRQSQQVCLPTASAAAITSPAGVVQPQMRDARMRGLDGVRRGPRSWR